MGRRDVFLRESGVKREICKWEQNKSISYFDIKLKYDLVPNSFDEKDKSAQYYFELNLKQVKSLAHLSFADDECSNSFYFNKKELNGNNRIYLKRKLNGSNCIYFDKEGFTNEERESKLNYWDRPTAIRANIFTSEDLEEDMITLKNSKLNEWTSERFLETVYDQDSNTPSRGRSKLAVLSIKYEQHLNRGERRLLKHLEDLYVQQIQCDIQFRFDGNVLGGAEVSDDMVVDDERNTTDGRDVGGHIAILTARSPVFAAMFKYQMEEIQTGWVTIKDVRKDIFKELLQYIYSGRTEVPLTEKTARPLFVAANKYDIEDLKEECVDFLLTSIRLDNAIGLLIWAHFYSVDRIKDAAIEFIGKNGKRISQQDDWETLVKNYPDLTLLATRLMLQ